MSAFYDALETRTPDEREAALLSALPRQIAHAQQHSAAFAQILAGVDAAQITSREALARLHDNYLHCGIRNRDDLGQMRKYDPAFTGHQPRF